MKRAAAVALLLVVAVAGWRYAHRDAPDAKLLFDRFWVDHEPRSDSDKFQVLFVDGEHPFGRFVTRTPWTGQWEGFHYHVVPREAGSLDLLFGATRDGSA